MKKTISALLVLLMLLGTFVSCAPESGTNDITGDTTSAKIIEETDEFRPVLRFAVTSDIHITNTALDNSTKLAMMIKRLSEYSAGGYDKLDAVVITGDIADNGWTEQWLDAKKVLDEYMPDDVKQIIAMGNHDYYKHAEESVRLFEQIFTDCASTSDTVINGYHFIIAADDLNGYSISAAQAKKIDSMISAAVADGKGEKPVFVINHIGNPPVEGSEDPAISSLWDITKKYDNVVLFTGHTHSILHDERSVTQGDFTRIHVGSLYQFHLPTYSGDGDIEYDNESNAQCWLVEVDAQNRMQMRCWDIYQDKFVGRTWLFESWDKENFVYTKNHFTSDDIFFADDASVSVTPVSVDEVKVTFPPVAEASLLGKVYEVTVKDSEGNVAAQLHRGCKYFLSDHETPLSVNVPTLVPGREYTVSVRAMNNPYSSNILESEDTLYSQPISSDFSITNYSLDLKADLVDTVITESGISNAAPFDFPFIATKTPVISYDESIGKNVITFDGTSDSTVKAGPYTHYSKFISSEMTFEAYFKVDAAPGTSYLPIISAQHNAAFGLTASAFENGKGTVDFRLSDARFRFKNIGFEYTVDEYYHVTAVYNGSTLALYLNGELADEIETKNTILLPTETAQYICFGSSPDGAGECESLSYCTVADFNLYSYAMDAEQVKTVYERTTAK